MKKMRAHFWRSLHLAILCPVRNEDWAAHGEDPSLVVEGVQAAKDLAHTESEHRAGGRVCFGELVGARARPQAAAAEC